MTSTAEHQVVGPGVSRRMAVRPLIPLCLAAFAGFLNLFGVNPFFTQMAGDLNAAVSLIGYSATAALLMTAVAGAFIGPMVGRLGGIRRTLVVGLFIASLSAVGTALADQFGWFVVARLLAGVGGSITGGVTVAAAAMLYQGRERQRALAIVTASMAMAVVIGIFLMTLLAGPFGWRGAFLLLGFGLAAIALLNWLMLPTADRSNAAPVAGRIALLIDSYRPLLANRSLRRLLVTAMLHPAILNGATAYLGALLISRHGVSTHMVGLVFSLIGVTYFAGNLLAGSVSARKSHISLGAGILVMGVGWWAGYLLMVSPIYIAMSFAVATFAGGIAWVTLLSMVAERTSADPGTAMVLTSSLLSLGAAAGIGISAGLLDITGYSGIAAGIGILMVAAAIIGWVRPELETLIASEDSSRRAPVHTRPSTNVSQVRAGSNFGFHFGIDNLDR